MNKFIYKIKQLIKIYFFNQKIDIDKKAKKAYIMLAADYGNIGDIAITYAQRKFLEKNLREYKIIEIPLKYFYRNYLCIKNNLNPQDVITIIGGGNTGDLYWHFEEARRFIIRKFKKNKVISFPQTVDFSTEKELRKSARNIFKE